MDGELLLVAPKEKVGVLDGVTVDETVGVCVTVDDAVGVVLTVPLLVADALGVTLAVKGTQDTTFTNPAGPTTPVNVVGTERWRRPEPGTKTAPAVVLRKEAPPPPPPPVVLNVPFP